MVVPLIHTYLLETNVQFRDGFTTSRHSPDSANSVPNCWMWLSVHQPVSNRRFNHYALPMGNHLTHVRCFNIIMFCNIHLINTKYQKVNNVAYLAAAIKAASSSLNPLYFFTSRTNLTKFSLSSFPSLNKFFSARAFSSAQSNGISVNSIKPLVLLNGQEVVGRRKT